MKIILDTNVLVSAYTARGICAGLFRYISAEHELIGEVSLMELRYLLRDRFRASPELISTVKAKLRDEHIVPKPTKHSPLPIRDPDQWVLTSAIDGQTDLLVTGDQDLLVRADRAPLAIVDPRGCWDRLRR